MDKNKAIHEGEEGYQWPVKPILITNKALKHVNFTPNMHRNSKYCHLMKWFSEFVSLSLDGYISH